MDDDLRACGRNDSSDEKEHVPHQHENADPQIRKISFHLSITNGVPGTRPTERTGMGKQGESLHSGH